MSAAIAGSCTVAVVLIGWEATTTMPSCCGNARRDLAAQWNLAWFGPALVAGTVATWRAANSGERQVCRVCATVAAVLWVACTGFVRNWW
ncbi:hypothetical protein PX52LOC_00550 [Limnoglobus roseus]|uniref:Uncharacterized protein n=1 Tax=Limnoglobus roseus TaxID=2598579 RepID=A0A5C1A775_9BACT|nr:hypothetical protein PX52LOC_00550 [Limnoglobus roseus]